MNQLNTPSSPGTQSLHALHERIEQPCPFIEVKDTSNLNIHVTFSSEAAFQTFIEVVGKGAAA